MKLHFISDTHNNHRKVKVPECDILFHCGDWSAGIGNEKDTLNFIEWLDKQPARYKIVIPGNHEVNFSRNAEEQQFLFDSVQSLYLLNDSSITVEGLNIYGLPWTPTFGHGWAYNAANDRVEAAHLMIPYIGDIYDKIPEDTDILLTHGPAYGILDLTPHSSYDRRAGCATLTNHLSNNKRLKIHAFGHLHHCGGHSLKVKEDFMGDTNYIAVNAAVLDDFYKYKGNGVSVNLEDLENA